VIDDTKDMHELLRVFLKREMNVDVTEAPSGHAGIKQIQTNHFDLVVCDLIMPDSSGLDVMAYLRARLEIDTWFILFTCAKNTLSHRQLENIVAIEKPGYEELIETIKWLVSTR
jgi:DNA-binding response OmpR family regulator